MKDTKPFIISFCSGKIGVGKSILAANVANKISKEGKITLLCDTNLQSPTLHLYFELDPFYCIQDFIKDNKLVDKISTSINSNLKIITSRHSPMIIEHDIFNRSLDMIIANIDTECIIFDCNSGVSVEVLECCRVSDVIFIVLTDEPSSLIDAYGLIKILQTHRPDSMIQLIINNVIDKEDADDTMQKLNMATMHFLSANFKSLGFIPYDRAVKTSIIRQELLLDFSPMSVATQAISTISDSIHLLIDTTSNIDLLV